MLGALLSQVKGVFGKAYLYAGVLPAAVLVAGWFWFLAGRRSLESAAVGMFSPSKEHASGVVLSALLILALALLFFAVRQLSVSALQTLPLPGIRGVFIGRQSHKRQRAQSELAVSLTARTAVRWLRHDLRGRYFVDPNIAVPAVAQAVASSRAARDAWSHYLAAGRRPTTAARSAGRILDGLTDLFAFAAPMVPDKLPSEAADEIARWRELAADGRHLALVLAAVEREANRRFVRARRRCSRWPEDIWIEPTALGNRQAVLDDYAQARYGIDTGSLWIRLVGVLSAAERREVSDAELSVEVMVNLCVSLTVLAAGTLLATIVAVIRSAVSGYPAPSWTAVWFVVIPVALAWGSYQGAVYAHVGLSLRVIRLIDLHRLLLVRELGYHVSTVAEEKALFGELQSFFDGGLPRSPTRPVSMPGA